MSKAYAAGRLALFDYLGNEELERVSSILECQIWGQFDWYNTSFSKEGYEVFPVVIISLYGYEIINVLVNSVKHFALMIDIKQITPTTEDYKRFKTRASYWLHSIDVVSSHNLRIRDGLPVWAKAVWQIRSLTSATWMEVLQIGESSDISLYYLEVPQFPQCIRFYFRTSRYPQFDLRLNEFKKLLGFEQWLMIPGFRRNAGSFNPHFPQLEAYPRLTHETIPTFLDAIKPYL